MASAAWVICVICGHGMYLWATHGHVGRRSFLRTPTKSESAAQGGGDSGGKGDLCTGYAHGPHGQQIIPEDADQE